MSCECDKQNQAKGVEGTTQVNNGKTTDQSAKQPSTACPSLTRLSAYPPKSPDKVPQSPTTTSLSSISSSTKPSTPSASSKYHTVRHLSNQEYQDLRARRLYFYCKQPYSPLHQCPNKSEGEDDEDSPDVARDMVET